MSLVTFSAYPRLSQHTSGIHESHVSTSFDAGPSGDTLPSVKSEGVSSSSGSHNGHAVTNITPLGLGLGGLERKVRFIFPLSTWH